MSARNRARRNVPRGNRAAHLSRPPGPGIAVRDAIAAPTPEPEHPIPVTIEEPKDRERRLAEEAAARLPMSIAMARPVRYQAAVPLNELRAWLEAYAPKTWERMQVLDLKKPRKRRSAKST